MIVQLHICLLIAYLIRIYKYLNIFCYRRWMKKIKSMANCKQIGSFLFCRAVLSTRSFFMLLNIYLFT